MSGPDYPMLAWLRHRAAGWETCDEQGRRWNTVSVFELVMTDAQMRNALRRCDTLVPVGLFVWGDREVGEGEVCLGPAGT